MRLFAAVDPSADAVRHLSAALPTDPDTRWRWAPPEKWHLTLAFYGETDDATADELTERLARAAARSAPMTLTLAGLGTFPRQAARARVLWCALRGDTAPLARLADRATAAGRRCGIAMEQRAFRAHLTVARARGRSADAAALVAALSSYAGPAWTVHELRLVRSHLGPRAHHETLHRWPLSGARPASAGADEPAR